VTGLASVGVHPATMAILNDFIAVGTQLRLEMPGKAGVVSAVDTVEPPIVKLKGGSVVRVKDFEEALKLRGDVEKILFLGDLLVAYSEFVENDAPLIPSGYVEEWWALEVEEAVKAGGRGPPSIPQRRLEELIADSLKIKPTGAEAVEISQSLSVPLHPKYTYFWRNISVEELLDLRSRLLKAELKLGEDGSVLEIRAPIELEVKSSLERLLVPHRVEGGIVIVEGDDAQPLARCLGLTRQLLHLEGRPSVLELVSRIAGFEVRDKYPSFIGARMGRPEKGKERKMKPPVHVLFPVSHSGGPQRNVIEAAKGFVEVEIRSLKCANCGSVGVEPLCPTCGARREVERVCLNCGRTGVGDVCSHCKVATRNYSRRVTELEEILSRASSRVKVKGLGVEGGERAE